MSRPEHAEPIAAKRWPVIAISTAAVAAGLAAVYGIAALPRNADEAACRAAVETAGRLLPLVGGEVAAFVPAERPLRIPDLAFHDRSGAEHHLLDWRGRTVLLNLWATWCIPCRKEMPALDALQTELGSPAFEVVAVNIDTRNLEKPPAWLQEIGVSRLAYYADPSAKVFQQLKSVGRAAGMPTTLLIDHLGCELGTMSGPAEWASKDALKLISAALAALPS